MQVLNRRRARRARWQPTLLCALMIPTMVAAADDAKMRLSLPAGPLSNVLATLAEQSSVQLVYSGDLVKGKESPGLRGEYTLSTALQALLQGTNLSFRFTGDDAVVIEKPAGDRRVLGPVRVEGAQYTGSPQRGEGPAQLGGIRGGQDQEARGLRPVTAAVAAGAPTAIEDIPRSISVLTQDQIQAQDIEDIGDALKRLPGVTLLERLPSTGGTSSGAAPAYGASVSARGLSLANIQIDGGAPQPLELVGNGLLDLGSYERVELVRGPNGVFTGFDSPGGSLNLVRKRPGSLASTQVTARVGQFDRYKLNVDYSTPEALGSPVAFRGVASYEDQQFAWDNDHRRNALLYGMFDTPLGELARLEVGGRYTQIEERGTYQGSVRYYDGPNLEVPFGFNYAPDWVYLDTRDTELFSRLYVRLLENVNLDFGMSFLRAHRDSLDFSSNGAVTLLSSTGRPYQTCRNGVCTPRVTSLVANRGAVDNERIGVDGRLTGRFSTFGIDHSWNLAADLSESRTLGTSGGNTWNPGWSTVVSLDQWLHVPDFAPPDTVEYQYGAQSNRDLASTNSGIVVSDVLSWRERIALTLSARRSESESSTAALTTNPTTGQPNGVYLREESDGEEGARPQWRPSWALAVMPLRNLTVYGSYSEGSRDQSQLFALSGDPLDPTTYENSELGVKYGREAWLLTLSAYHLVQDNVAVSIPGTRGLCPPAPNSQCYSLSGNTIRSDGTDLELSGEIFRDLAVQASFNYNRNETIASQEPVVTRSPNRMAKLFATWRPFFLPRAQLRLGASYRARVYEKGTRREFDPNTSAVTSSIAYNFEEPSHVVFDFGATYAPTTASTLDLWVENVTDKKYFSTVGPVSNYLGQPRTISLAWSHRFGLADDGYARSPSTGRAPFGSPSNWYVSYDLGYTPADNWVATSSGNAPGGAPVRWTFESEAAPTSQIRLGYRLGQHWRVELAGGYRHAEFGSISGGAVAPFGLCGVSHAEDGVNVTSTCLEPQGEADHWDFAVDAIRDFGNQNARLRPFLGIGLGATRSSLDFSGRMDGIVDTAYRDWYRTANKREFTGIAGGEKLFGASSGWNPAMQVLAGLSFRVTDRAKLEATYRYRRNGNYDVDVTNVSNYSSSITGPDNILPGSGIAPLRSFEGDLDDHSLSIGLRWAFGGEPQ